MKFLYQYSDCNRQTFVANLRAMNISSGNVFPIATYTVNKYKNEAKELTDEKAALYKAGAIPKAITLMVAPPANTNQASSVALDGPAPANAPSGQQPAANAARPPSTPRPPAWNLQTRGTGTCGSFSG